MDEFLKMDLFFFVTTVVVVALGGILAAIGVKIYRILGHVESILVLARQETELIKEDIDDFRADMRRRGFSWLGLGKFVSRVSRVFTRRSRNET